MKTTKIGVASALLVLFEFNAAIYEADVLHPGRIKGRMVRRENNV